MAELVEKLTAQLGTSASPAAVLDKAAEHVRSALRRGESVDLLKLVHLRLTAEGLAGREQGAKAVYAQPLPGLIPDSTVAEKDELVIVIAAEKSDKFNQLLARRLTGTGRSAYLAEGLVGVTDTVKRHGADVVILDSDVESGDEIRQWLKSTPARSLISLIAVYGREETIDATNRFRVCEDEFVVEPYDIPELETVIANEIKRINLERKYFKHEVRFEFPPRTVYQDQAYDYMERLLAHSGLAEENQTGLCVAFREAVDNACRHGNKRQDGKLTSVAYVVDCEKVTVAVEDGGEGFDTSLYIDKKVSGDAVAVARSRHKEGRQGGLGIMLMLKSVDRLEYNREGNVVKLTKYLPRAVAAGSSRVG